MHQQENANNSIYTNSTFKHACTAILSVLDKSIGQSYRLLPFFVFMSSKDSGETV